MMMISAYVTCQDESSFNLASKGKVVPARLTKHHAMKAYCGSGGIPPFLL